MSKEDEDAAEEVCDICKGEIIPESWAQYGWGKGPYYGVGICGCAEGSGLPALKDGDILVDRNYHAIIARSTTYGYRPENIMSVQRQSEDGYFYPVIWHRKDVRLKDEPTPPQPEGEANEK